MNISVFDQQTALFIDKSLVRKQVKEILNCENISIDELAVYFVDTENISYLHNKFFNDPSPTDCISIPYDDPNDKQLSYYFLGEVFVCTEIALSYAENHMSDPLVETTLYVIHGLLHLLGYDDIDTNEEVIMREKEQFYLSLLKEKNLLPSQKKSNPSGS